jgi:hypothetical protein
MSRRIVIAIVLIIIGVTIQMVAEKTKPLPPLSAISGTILLG